MICKVSNDETSLEIEKTGHYEKVEDICCELPQNECRIVTCTYEVQKEEVIQQKVCTAVWGPEKSKVRGKFMYASSARTFVESTLGSGKVDSIANMDDLKSILISNK